MMIWCVTASVCLFACANISGPFKRSMRGALAFAGLLSVALLLDDLFLVHEELGPKYLGISEIIIVGMYGAGLLVYFTLFWRQLLSLEPFYLLLACALLGTSVVIDILVLLLT